MHLVITLIIDQSWIKARKDTKEATCSRAIVSSSNLKKIKFTKCRQARPTGFGVLRRPPPYRCYPVDGLRLGLRVLIRLIFICWHRCPVQPAPRPRLSVTVGLRVGLSDHRVPESDSGSAHWHTAAAMTVPQCGMGRGLTTDERAGTDTLSEASWSSSKWAVHIYYQYAKSEQCTILHIDFGVCILFCILKDIYAE
jgi:hypothetical protein